MISSFSGRTRRQTIPSEKIDKPCGPDWEKTARRRCHPDQRTADRRLKLRREGPGKATPPAVAVSGIVPRLDPTRRPTDCGGSCAAPPIPTQLPCGRRHSPSPNKTMPCTAANSSSVRLVAYGAKTSWHAFTLPCSHAHKPKKVALVASTRKALTWAWAVFSHDTFFDPALLAKA